MKLMNLAVATLVIAVGVTTLKYWPVWNQHRQVKQLLEMRECRGCNLTQVSLKGVDLQGVNLEGANLEGAELQGVKLGNARLKGANLRGANLQGADFGCTGISFNLNGNEHETNLDLKMGATSTKSSSENATLGFSLKANNQGVFMNFNLFGCADLEGVSLEEAIMPDGNIHP
ncbi:MAG: pentapeptide repeat-containing protein [Actinomycetota bacterium]